MLDFPKKIYQKLYGFATKTNMVACCREYPSLAWNKKELKFKTVQNFLRKNFSNPRILHGLYVHFPFCASRCSFCKYYSEIFTGGKTMDDYIKALSIEMQTYQVDFSRTTLDNIFFGGGTPTLLNSRQIEKYISAVFKYFKIDKKTQINIEATPETIKESTLKKWVTLGINRISLGAQSFNDNVLKNTGRLHGAKDVFAAFEIIKNVGVNFTGIDLIWGLPGENKQSYEKTMKETLRLAPDFIECYLLTPGGRTKINPHMPKDISIDEAIRIFKDGFLNNGYRMYFSGNFFGFIKKGVKSQNAMNRNTEGVYNYRSSCLGIGSGSSSTFPNIRYNITSKVNTYIKDFLGDKKYTSYYGFLVDPEDYKRQYIISQFGFYRKLDKNHYRKLFNKRIENDFGEEIEQSRIDGYITESKGKYIWHFNEEEMGHKDFFWYTIRYWYRPEYINKIIKDYNL